jgi:acetylornithine deacetylase/succinyl-diaminopimelate desuccinylase-like protein
MRLVPDQNSKHIFELFKKHVTTLVPRGIELSIKNLHGADAIIIGTNNRFVKASTDAMREVFNKETVFIRSGGSIPIVGDFETYLKIPSVMMGFGLPDDNLHAPNEKFHIPNFYRGIESLIRFFDKVGA